MSSLPSFINSWLRKVSSNQDFDYDYNSIFYKYSGFKLYENICFQRDEYFISVDKINALCEGVEFDTNTKMLQKIFGKPVSKIVITKNPQLEIYLYKFIKEQEKQKLLFHFFRNKLILISRIFPYASNEKILHYQNKHLKQLNLPKLDNKKDKVYIQGSDNERLLLIIDFEYTEHFMKSDKEFEDFVSYQFRKSIV